MNSKSAQNSGEADKSERECGEKTEVAPGIPGKRDQRESGEQEQSRGGMQNEGRESLDKGTPPTGVR